MVSPQERIEEKLTETNAIIEQSTRQMDMLKLPDYVQKLQISSLNQRLEDLYRENGEIERTTDKEEIVLTMHPEELPSGQVSVREFTLILGGLQNLTDSIANTLYNQPSEKGKIPQEILDRNTFVLNATRAGSFQAVLELKHCNQESFDEPVQTQTMEELFTLFDASNTSEKLTDVISFLGPRALRNYSDWTKSLKELNTSVDIKWVSSFKVPSKTTISSEKADRIYKVLSDFSETIEEEITVRGRITGANVRTRTFELFTNEGEKITGRIINDALPSVAAFELNKQCEVELLKVTTVYSSGRKEKVSWTLKEIKEY